MLGRLLWVDDEIDLLKAHIIFLKNKDYEVTTCSNGTDALDICREQPFDLILLDEPTSNVDSINEGIILKALKQQKQGKCIILVSHRESTMAIADRIYKVEKGCMYEYTK